MTQNKVKNEKKTQRATSLKDKFLALSVYAKIFTALAVVFFILGIATLGAFNGTGKSASVASVKEPVSMAYRLEYEEGQKLSDIYVNVGTVYASVGASKSSQTTQIRAYAYDGEDWERVVGNTAYFANIYATNASEFYKSNANYNWVALATDQSVTRTQIRLTFSADRAAADVNEVVFLDANGKKIKASVFAGGCQGVSAEETAKTLDAQGSFRKGDSFRYNFTPEEEYILESIKGIELGNQANSANTYVMSTDYNSFGILVYGFFTLIFGKSTFGLRLPSFLSAFGVFILLFFFGKKLFRSDKWGLVTSALFGFGGMFFTVGRLGTPLALALFLVTASIYLMYNFYAKGVDGAHPVRTALPVLFSGIFAGAAFAVNALALFPACLSVLLFALGMVRLVKHRDYLAKKALNASVAALENVEENAQDVQERETALNETSSSVEAEYNQKFRLTVGFFVGSVVISFLLLVLAGLPTASAFARYYGSQNYFALLGKGLAQCFSIGDVTAFTAGNALTPFGWFIALKGATLFYRAAGNETALIAQLNAQANVIAAYVALAAFVFCTVYVCMKLASREENKKIKAIFRAYIGLIFGLIASLLPYLFMPNVSATQSFSFNMFYLSFIALAFFIAETENEVCADKAIALKRKKAADVVLIVLFTLLAITFILTVPMCFGYQVSVMTANVMFNWTALLSNGRYGLIAFD